MAYTTKEKMQVFWGTFKNDNIFDKRKGDGVAYLILYIILPVIITVVSLTGLPTDNTSIVYCYVSIFISVVNSMYDAGNRWEEKLHPVKNIKLFTIMFSDMLISVYCLYIILHILISQQVPAHCDWFLLVYFLGSMVALYDVVACFTSDMALRDMTK